MNWEIITFLGYFVILLGVALIFYFNGSNKNSEDFFLGGRSMGPWVTGPVGTGLRYVCMAADGSARLYPGFWLPGQMLDRHRFGARHPPLTGSYAPSGCVPSPRPRMTPSPCPSI